MSIEISKKLLSEVLNIENERISKRVDRFCFPSDNIIAVAYYMKDGWQHLNIHQLATKCKEWAITKGYVILEYPLIVHVYNENTKEKVHSEGDLTTITFDVSRVIKSAQWILDNKDKQ